MGGNTFTTEEIYTYSGYLLAQKQTKGHNTSEVVKVNYVYDAYGNLKEKTMEPPGGDARTVKYEYDPSKRFINKTTDAEGLETFYQYNQRSGNLLEETDHLALRTQYTYDSWDTLVTVTNHLGNEVNTTYVKSGYDYTLSTTGDDGSMEVSRYNRLQQLVEQEHRDVMGQLVKQRFEYDAMGRISRESEPFVRGLPSGWNTRNLSKPLHWLATRMMLKQSKKIQGLDWIDVSTIR